MFQLQNHQVTRSNGMEITRKKFYTEVGKSYFADSLIELYNELFRDVVNVNTV